MRRLRDEQGQTLAMSVLFITVLLGMAALVVDVGAWFRESRRLQAVADAAALAGAQALPDDPAAAIALARDYALKNGGDVAPEEVTVSEGSITVRAGAPAQGVFSRVFELAAFRITASATAAAAPVGAAKGAAPIVVPETHPLLQCLPEPCFDQSTTLELINLNGTGSAGAGAFGLLDFDTETPGTASAGEVADWIRDGYQRYVGVDPEYGDVEDYTSATGAKFNSSDVKSALSAQIGRELLLPVYRSISGSGANARYDIVGWVGFQLESFSGSGSSGTIRGMFREVTWEGREGGAGVADFGARTVRLTA